MDPLCPHCDTIQIPERLAPGLYLCESCAKEFRWPPIEVTYREQTSLVGELLGGGVLPTLQPPAPPLRDDQIAQLRRARDAKRLP